MELMVSPPLHTEKGLGHEEVVQIVLETLNEIKSNIVVGVVLYMSTEDTGNYRVICRLNKK